MDTTYESIQAQCISTLHSRLMTKRPAVGDEEVQQLTRLWEEEVDEDEPKDSKQATRIAEQLQLKFKKLLNHLDGKSARPPAGWQTLAMAAPAPAPAPVPAPAPAPMASRSIRVVSPSLYPPPSSPVPSPLPIDRQLPGSVDTQTHIKACCFAIARLARLAAVQTDDWKLVLTAYDHWNTIELKTSADRTLCEKGFVRQMRHMECHFGWLAGRSPDDECIDWLGLGLQRLVNGVPPVTDWEARDAEIKRMVHKRMLAQNRMARAWAARVDAARAARPRSPIGKPVPMRRPESHATKTKAARRAPQSTGTSLLSRSVEDLADATLASTALAGSAR